MINTYIYIIIISYNVQIQTIRNFDLTFSDKKSTNWLSNYKVFSASNQSFTRETSVWKITIFAFLVSTVIGLSATGMISLKSRSIVFLTKCLVHIKELSSKKLYKTKLSVCLFCRKQKIHFFRNFSS